MISLRYQLIQDLFEERRVKFVWRNGPGNEQNAQVDLPVHLRLEPYTMFITSATFWSMGAFSYSQSTLSPETTVGRYCSISNAVSLFNSEHPVDWVSTSPFSYNPMAAPIFTQAIEDASNGQQSPPWPYDDMSRAPVQIGHDVWIGQHVQIKRGISIGNGAVIAAGAVVAKNVPPYSIVGGVPAKIIRMRFNDRLIERLEDIRWWEYSFTDFRDLHPADPSCFLDGLEERIKSAAITPYQPEPVTLQTLKQHLENKATAP